MRAEGQLPLVFTLHFYFFCQLNCLNNFNMLTTIFKVFGIAVFEFQFDPTIIQPYFATSNYSMLVWRFFEH